MAAWAEKPSITQMNECRSSVASSLHELRASYRPSSRWTGALRKQGAALLAAELWVAISCQGAALGCAMRTAD